MKILLIKPYEPYPYSRNEYTYNRIWPPLCISNCAALLERDGCNVKILDAHACRIKPAAISKYIKGYDKIFITSSSLDRWQCPNTDISFFLKSVCNIRAVTEEVYIMGYHGTVNPEEMLTTTMVKAVIRGGPEYAVLEICRNMDMDAIDGITFIRSGKVISTPARDNVELKSLPVPAYHLLDMKKYFYEILGKNFALFELSRGCNYKCKFCNKIMYGNGISYKTENQAIAELKIAIERHNVKTGYFIDLEFLSDKYLVNYICNFLISMKYDFKWCCQTRPDSLDLRILENMYSAGCRVIHFGVESGYQEALNYINKNISIDRIMESVEMCKQVGIRTVAFFLCFPHETRIERKKIYDFAKKLNTDFISLHMVTNYDVSGNFQVNHKNKEINRFICKTVIKYYLRISYLNKLNMFTLLKSLRLFIARIKSLR